MNIFRQKVHCTIKINCLSCITVKGVFFRPPSVHECGRSTRNKRKLPVQEPRTSKDRIISINKINVITTMSFVGQNGAFTENRGKQHATPRETSSANKHSRNCDYFVIIESLSHFTMLAKYVTIGPKKAPLKKIRSLWSYYGCILRLFLSLIHIWRCRRS